MIIPQLKKKGIDMSDYIPTSDKALYALIFYDVDKTVQVRDCSKFPKSVLKENAYIEVRFEGKKVKGKILRIHGNWRKYFAVILVWRKNVREDKLH